MEMRLMKIQQETQEKIYMSRMYVTSLQRPNISLVKLF
jgi:hypothetical protein